MKLVNNTRSTTFVSILLGVRDGSSSNGRSILNYIYTPHLLTPFLDFSVTVTFHWSRLYPISPNTLVPYRPSSVTPPPSTVCRIK